MVCRNGIVKGLKSKEGGEEGGEGRGGGKNNEERSTEHARAGPR